MAESPRHSIEWKNPDTREHAVDDPICMKGKHRWNRPVVLEVSIVQPSRRRLGIVLRREGKRRVGSILCLGPGPGCMGVPTLRKSSCTF